METTNKNSGSSFLQLIKIGKPAVWVLVFAVILSLLETGASLIVPLFTKNLVDQVAKSGIEMSLIFLLSGAFIIQTISGGVSFYLMSYIGEQFVSNIRKKLWDHILELPIPYFDKHQSGETMSRVTQDTNTVKMLITNHLVSSVSGIVSIIGALIILIMIDWKMTLIMLCSIPVSMIVLFPLGRKVYSISKQTQDELASFSAHLGRVLSDIRLVKSYNGQILERKKGHKGIHELFRFGLKEAKIQAIVSPFMTTILMIVLVILIGYGGARVASGDLTAGSLVAIIIYMFQIVIPFSQLATFFTNYQKAMGATERIQNLLDLPVERNDSHGKTNHEETIIFDRVSFGYESGKTVIKDLSFHIEPGQTVAFVGPSGSGKTTIFSLIERFYEPQQGSIRIGNSNIQNLQLTSWRGKIGYVSQESPIMSGTIKDNICYGLQRSVDEAEIRHAAELANAAGFIENLPNQYDTEVGERGIKLSGGQRQRIAIARALLRDPKILLLDEATSNLDSESEGLVQSALQHLMAGRTTLIIAHRLSTVVEADQIIVIEEGAVSGIGTHRQLMESHPLYQKLVQQQMKTEPAI
ncbi:ABC transporter ATP-binding protein [Siminovitchia fortis]|uniref:ABC transporter ATP-binding protein n=2 Tax=Bacillales TaxID=1385 RepID=A0A443IS59_9BACI|nr:ABC transporter ATP-binding protein [Siminovitchia fortis]RWR09665.1 ABC transporter ATP-binding protein [Siminovitchia fortis]WHY82286.1 ABC transporter ATP-binding protein [Siminovitchia fortis]